jgi:hypothetical protein
MTAALDCSPSDHHCRHVVPTALVNQLEDSLGLEAVNKVAMTGAFRNIGAASPDYVLVDGDTLPKVTVTQSRSSLGRYRTQSSTIENDWTRLNIAGLGVDLRHNDEVLKPKSGSGRH